MNGKLLFIQLFHFYSKLIKSNRSNEWRSNCEHLLECWCNYTFFSRQFCSCLRGTVLRALLSRKKIPLRELSSLPAARSDLLPRALETLQKENFIRITDRIVALRD